MPDDVICKGRLIPVGQISFNAVSWAEAIERVVQLGRSGAGAFVGICNTHSVYTASSNAVFRSCLSGASLVTPDGMPVAWAMRLLGVSSQPRIDGPSLMWKTLQQLEQEGGARIGLYGNTEGVLVDLTSKIERDFPSVKVVVAISPPYGPVSAEFEAESLNRIRESRVEFLWVSLGCPKQEIWISSKLTDLRCVAIGVGAAFDYHVGKIVRAPVWMQNAGLEWLHRLGSEPRRLWRRYFISNSYFLCLLIFILARIAVRGIVGKSCRKENLS